MTEPAPEPDPVTEPAPEADSELEPAAPALTATVEERDSINPPWEPSTSVRPRRILPPGVAPSPPIPRAREAARAAAMLTATGGTVVRHARARRARWIGGLFAGIAAGALVFGGAAAVTAAVTAPAISDRGGLRLADSGSPAAATSPSAFDTQSPAAVPQPTPAAVPASADICTIPAVAAALNAGDDPGTIAAAGGAVAFRSAIASGHAPCINLADPARSWVVVNKLRPSAPLDHEPASLALPAGVQSLAGGALQPAAATALSTMAGAAAAAGVGEIALDSGYRSYATQQTNYGNGGPSVDASVARPGYSEHQTGLAADVVACSGGCGTLDALASTPQGAWIAANSWRYGWIVRYENGKTAVTGYESEPWHLRYIGTDLAAAYHAGNWHSLEEFFGLPAAPGYAG